MSKLGQDTFSYTKYEPLYFLKIKSFTFAWIIKPEGSSLISTALKICKNVRFTNTSSFTREKGEFPEFLSLENLVHLLKYWLIAI